MNWKQQKQALEDAYVRRLLVDYGIQEVTTQRQAKNGTREFEFPVSARKYYINNEYCYSKTKLRLAVYKSGYVRNCNSCSSNYQINRQYKQEQRQMYLIDGKLEVKKYFGMARTKIWSGLARLNYMLEYYLKNYKK